MNGVLGVMHLLNDEPLTENGKKLLREAVGCGQMLAELLNDVLDFSKIEAGKMEVRPTVFNLDAVVSAQCDMVRPLAERKRIDLAHEAGPGLEGVEQDQAKVQQILANLLSNAVKFTPQGGRVDVFSRLEVVEGEPVSEFLMEVVDTGVGIAEDERQTIFEKFRQGHVFQRDDAMSREFTGTGLGLSIVHRIVTDHGGRIQASSAGPGAGSTFRVTLPLAQIGSDAAPPRAPAADPAAGRAA